MSAPGQNQNIRILLAHPFLIFGENAGILGAECSLHISRRALQIAQHEYGAPFGNGDAHRELPHREGDGLIVVFDSLFYFIIGVFDFFIFIRISIADGEDDLILSESITKFIAFQQLFQSLGTGYPVQPPQCMGEFIPQLWCREGILFLCGEGMEKFLTSSL